MTLRLFGRMPIAHIDPDEIVARGAVIYAALLARDEAFDEVVVTDGRRTAPLITSGALQN